MMSDRKSRKVTGPVGIAAAVCAVLLCSCGLFGGGALEGRAADYYNYMAGKTPGTKYSSFLSPAYRKAMGKENMRTFDDAKQIATEPNTRYPDATGDDVSVSADGRFAYTLVRRDLGDAFRNMPPLKWVKDGRRWYLYLGSDAEETKYGPWPAGLSPMEPPGSS